MQIFPHDTGFLLLRLGLYYIILVVIMTIAQNYLLYAPTKYTFLDLSYKGKLCGLSPWPVDSEEYLGLISRDPDQMKRGTVVVFHGNAGSALDRIYYSQALVKLGFQVILLEYPGYGARKGKTGELYFLSDCLKSVELLERTDTKPVYFIGESLGAGVATGVIAKGKIVVDGLVLITPWSTLPDLAQKKFWFLPAKWICRDRYDNIKNLSSFKQPVAVALARHDRIIPKDVSMKLFQQIESSKKLWIFEKAGHNDWPNFIHDSWWSEVMAFIAPEPEL
jgi:uncharacterized protein